MNEDNWDYFSTMKTATDKARAEGRAEGKAEGKAEGRAEGKTEANIENAIKMKTKGYPIEDIADITGLSREEIEKI